MAPRLRKPDLLEIEASGGNQTPLQVLLEGVRSPDGCYVAVDSDDVPQAIFGTTPSDEPLLGYAWMMATEDIENHWVQVARLTQPVLERVRGTYRVLSNMVHSENELHIKWIRWAGFTFLQKVEHNGHEFFEFAKTFNVGE